MATLINNTMASELADAVAQATGIDPIDNLDLTNIIDVAKTSNILSRTDSFVKALAVRIYKTLYTDVSLPDSVDEDGFVNSNEWGGIMQVVSIDIPDIANNPAFDNIVSGQVTLGQNTFPIPIVDQKLTGITNTWSIPIVIDNGMMNDAFNSVDGLVEFYSYVRVQVRNAIIIHRKEMSNQNRNNLIGEKIAMSQDESTSGTHVVSLTKAVQDNLGLTSEPTWNDIVSNEKYQREIIKVLKKYKRLMSGVRAGVFTPNGKIVPMTDGRYRQQFLGEFIDTLETGAMSTTFHNEFVQAPETKIIDCWQGVEDASTSLTFADLSKIDVKTSSGTTIEQAGVVGLSYDLYSLIHTIVSNRVGVQHDDIKDKTGYSYQFVDRYVNLLNRPAVVYTVKLAS